MRAIMREDTLMCELKNYWFWVGYNDGRLKKSAVLWWVLQSGHPYMDGYAAGVYDESCLNDTTNIY